MLLRIWTHDDEANQPAIAVAAYFGHGLFSVQLNDTVSAETGSRTRTLKHFGSKLTWIPGLVVPDPFVGQYDA